MLANMDALTSPTLKHLREEWWDDEFTEFLAETLRPRPGNRILDVGCGTGVGELSIGRLQVSQLRLLGIDLSLSKLVAARARMAAHNQRVSFAAGDVLRLPYRDRAFDATFCVAVLQHVTDLSSAVAELARVTAPGGRVVVVEPDNSARYFFSSSDAGRRLLQVALRLFAAQAGARGEQGERALGPTLPGVFASRDLEPLDVRLFPVSRTQLGAPADEVWEARRRRIATIVSEAEAEQVRDLGREYLTTLDAYRADARQAGATFVEVQSTLLFATVGQRL